MYLIILGTAYWVEMLSKHRWVFAVGGLAYISFAYIPLPTPTSGVFGFAGSIMAVFMVFIFVQWAKQRTQLSDMQKIVGDYRMVGYFFFAMATYTSCPFLGVKTFALAPEKMIQYGLQQEAVSFAFHILTELVLGWLFIALSLKSQNAASTAAQRQVSQSAA